MAVVQTAVIRSSLGFSGGYLVMAAPPLQVAGSNYPFLSSSNRHSGMGWNPLPRTTREQRGRNLVIRAARTESKGPSLGFRAPDFKLSEPLTGKVWRLENFESCPALLRARRIAMRVMFLQKGLAVIAISSNSVTTHPQDGPDYMAEDAKIFKYPFPYLYDESQEVARSFGAVCTPEFFLFKKDGCRQFELVYHGQFDDSRPSNNLPITGRDLSLAIESVLNAQPVPSVQKPSVGCSIKWHPTVAA